MWIRTALKLLDAPVSGGRAGAVARTLTTLVGGEATTLRALVTSLRPSHVRLLTWEVSLSHVHNPLISICFYKTREKQHWRDSKDTDVAVRTFLAQRGMKKGDFAKFVEEAVRWRVFDQTVAETKARNAEIPDQCRDR